MWEPMDDIYIRNNLDFTEEKPMPTVRPSCGRGKTIRRPNLHELKPPKALQELIEKNIQKKRPLGRGRGKSLKHMSSRPGKTESDSDSTSGRSPSIASTSTSTPAQSVLIQHDNINDILPSTQLDPVTNGYPDQLITCFGSRKAVNPVDWTDADFPSLGVVANSPSKPVKKNKPVLKNGKESKEKSAQPLPPGDNCDNENSVIIDNLPKDVSSEDIRSLLDSYGQVLNINMTRHENSSSCKVKLDSVVSCEWAVSCLHDTDSLFPEDDKIMTCVPAWL